MSKREIEAIFEALTRELIPDMGLSYSRPKAITLRRYQSTHEMRETFTISGTIQISKTFSEER